MCGHAYAARNSRPLSTAESTRRVTLQSQVESREYDIVSNKYYRAHAERERVRAARAPIGEAGANCILSQFRTDGEQSERAVALQRASAVVRDSPALDPVVGRYTYAAEHERKVAE